MDDLAKASQKVGFLAPPAGPPAHSADEAVIRINRGFEEKTTQEEAKRRGLDYIDIVTTPINPDLLYLIKPEAANKALVMPFFRIGKKLRLAVAHPESPETQEVLKNLQAAGYVMNLNLASENGIKESLKIYEKTYHEKKVIENVIAKDELQAYEKEIQSLTNLQAKFQDITSEEALNYINVGAIKTGASDVHYQPEERDVLVRFRIDGVLQNIFRIEKHIFENIANQIKYKAKMKLNINNIPQDGRFSFTINERKIDVRVSSLPTEFGETIVCRFLDTQRSNFDFTTLGFRGVALEHIKRIIDMVYGMVLVTGPTGSGKTTTLYSILDKFNNPERKIITLEDPIEYHLSMVSQSQVNEKRGYDFANGLRSILRQDPDIIMIGEIRDLETAQVAAQAALTGHIVLSTLHTNNAIETIPRLLNMGLPAYMIASSLTTIIAQRLVRKVCPKCATDVIPKKMQRKEIEETIAAIQAVTKLIDINIPEKIKKTQGCDACSHTGYSGQVAIIETLQIDNEMRDIILSGANIKILSEESRKKRMLTMKEDGILKVIEGITTLEEVHRVSNISTS